RTPAGMPTGPVSAPISRILAGLISMIQMSRGWATRFLEVVSCVRCSSASVGWKTAKHFPLSDTLRPAPLPKPWPATSPRGHRHAAVGHDHRADHKAGAIRGEEGHHLCDLFRLRGAAYGRCFAVLGQEARAIVDYIVEDVGHHIADADGIDANTMLDRLQRQGARQLRQRALGSGISGNGGEGEEGCVRGDID